MLIFSALPNTSHLHGALWCSVSFTEHRRVARRYLEEGGALQDAGGAAHLSDGVHGELRRADVHHGDAEAGGQDGPDGASTGAVVTDHHILQEDGPSVRTIIT